MRQSFKQDNNLPANDNGRGLGDGVFILDIDALTDGKFWIEPRGIAEWLDTLAIDLRVLISAGQLAPRFWHEFGFVHFRRRAGVSSAQSGCSHVAKLYRRVFVATSQGELSAWSSLLDQEQLLIACVRDQAQGPSHSLGRHLTATHFMRRFMFPIPPAILSAA